jgi:hypothetical protein
VTKEAYGFIESSWPEVSVAVIRMLPKESATPYRIKDRFDRLEKLVQRLETGIPPNEVTNLAMDPSSMEDVLTAGWIRKISGIKKASVLNSSFDTDSLERLVLKGCESSYVQSQWGSLLNGSPK